MNSIVRLNIYPRVYKKNVVKCSHSYKKKNIIIETTKWLSWSVVYNIYNKKAVMELEPSVVTSAQLVITTGALLFTNRYPILESIKKTNLINHKFICMFALLSSGQWFGNHLGNVATSFLTISSVNIIKSSEPILSMIIMYILFKKIENIKKFILVFPIILGIILCNLNDLTYTHYGATLCTLSNMCHIIKNIISKKYFADVILLDGHSLFTLTMVGSLLISLPILINNLSLLTNISSDLTLYLLLSGFGYYFNSVAAFELITTISPITFSILNIYKRLVIIMSFYIINMNFPTVLEAIGLIISNLSLFIYISI